KLAVFIEQFAALKGAKILVHGGGKIATQLSEKLGIATQLIDGRRVTTADSLEVVTMVYAGLINKSLVAQLQGLHTNAIGLSGADANLIQAKKRIHPSIDFGFVGDLEETSVSAQTLKSFIDTGLCPVFSAITHNGQGQLLNTNADTIASALALALSATFETTLIYGFEKKGVLEDVANEASVIPHINQKRYINLKNENSIHSGMLPKLDAAFTALNGGIARVIIGDACEINQLESPAGFGTSLTLN
ncbi:MAG: acetylglutamate kinase, partial [Sphingobacteriaceae bacterium]